MSKPRTVVANRKGRFVVLVDMRANNGKVIPIHDGDQSMPARFNSVGEIIKCRDGHMLDGFGRMCGLDVVCIPDGLCMCDACVAKEDKRAKTTPSRPRGA